MKCIKLILSYQILLYSGEKCHSLKILKVAFGDQPVGKQTFEWFSQFKNDVTSVKYAKPEGQETVAFHNHPRHIPPPPHTNHTIFPSFPFLQPIHVPLT